MTAMNEQDKHAFLNEMRRGGEIYQAEVWGTVTADKKTQAMFSSLPSRMALADVYAYIGMSEENINIVAVNTQKPDVILGRMRLPFEKITSAEIHNSLIPGRKTVDLMVEGRAVRLRFTGSTIGTDLQNQKEGIRKIADRLKAMYH